MNRTFANQHIVSTIPVPQPIPEIPVPNDEPIIIPPNPARPIKIDEPPLIRPTSPVREPGSPSSPQTV